MTTEQFTQVVEAILEGKYSWACVLILRFAGYNPLHYIPYRTYNRLMKDNCQNDRNKGCSSHPRKLQASEELSYQGYATHIKDLGYLEPLDQHVNVRGGNRSLFLINLRTMLDFKS
ncbi:HetP family heterocyst commitment protein [Phormidium tenue FACHB-886]|nr:HetP family heterocyst commitment protein [Phormidium tenue FACHB-886]